MAQNLIYETARSCLDDFKTCIDSLAAAAVDTEWLDDQIDRFNLWAAHGVIFGSYDERTSMDWRLRDRPDLAKLMLELLNLLRDYLSCIRKLASDGSAKTVARNDTFVTPQDPISKPRRSSSGSESDPQEKPIIAGPMERFQKRAEETIDRLFRLSAGIRSAGMAYRHAKAVNFVEWDKTTRPYTNLTQKFRDKVTKFFGDKMKAQARQPYMGDRLIETVCLRQRELAFTQHRRKYDGIARNSNEVTGQSRPPSAIPTRSLVGHTRQGRHDKPVSAQSRVVSQQEAPKMQGTNPSHYTATKVPTIASINFQNQTSTPEESREIDTVDDQLRNLPPAPKIPDGKAYFECPYCAIPFPKSQFDGATWRAHVLKDLRPYICVLPDCSKPYIMYENCASWMEHMSKEPSHSVSKWKCAAPPHSEPIIFDLEHNFMDHIKREHHVSFTNDIEELQVLADLSKHESSGGIDLNLLSECPLCSIPFLDGMDARHHIAEELVDNAVFQSLHGSSSDSSAADGHEAGQRRPSEIENDLMFPWSSWETENSQQVVNDLIVYEADLKVVPIPTDAETVELAKVNEIIISDQHKLYEYLTGQDPVLKAMRDYIASRQLHVREAVVYTDFVWTPSYSRPYEQPGDENVHLVDRILDQYVTSKFDDNEQDFLPEGCLSELLTQNSVRRQLQGDESIDYSGDPDADLVYFILRRARKIFAIAIVIDLEGEKLRLAMSGFRDSEIGDEYLPLNRNDQTELPCFSRMPWTRTKIRAFQSSQWAFLAPVFSRTRFKLDLEPEHILPFTWRSYDVKEGSFSHVFEVVIHPRHQHDPILSIDGTPAKVAVKEIKDIFSDEELHTENEQQRRVNKQWEAEAKALDEISGLHHPHILQRIAAITRGRKHYFMFQWADGGSLRDFWQENGRPNLDSNLVRELVLQLRGLADALDALHTFKGEGSYRHGDLKPENILIFKDNTQVGTLKIADMGLARHHTEGTLLRPSTTTRYGTLRYEPPETVTSNDSWEGRSRRYDIWSFGCITLELIVWLLYGYDELVEFNKSIQGSELFSGQYFSTRTQGGVLVAEIHPVVAAYMDHISRDQECQEITAVRDLLEIVRKKLLVVALQGSDAFSIEDNRGDEDVQITITSASAQMGGPFRGSAGDLCLAIDAIIGKGEENERYWFTGTKREDRKAPRFQSIPKLVTHEFLSPNAAALPLKPIVHRSKGGSSIELSPSLAQIIPSSMIVRIVPSGLSDVI